MLALMFVPSRSDQAGGDDGVERWLGTGEPMAEPPPITAVPGPADG
jgi:hypothetical protein